MLNSSNKVHCVNINNPCAEPANFDQNYEIDIENLPVAKLSEPIFSKNIKNEIRNINIHISILFCFLLIAIIIITSLFI